MPAEHVEVGDQGLGVDVVGSAAAAARAAVRSTPWVRWSTWAIASPPAASASAGLASTSFWYSATARVEVTGGQRVLRGRVARVDVLLVLGPPAAPGPAPSGWCRPVMPWVAICSSTWVSSVRRSSSGGASWSSGIIRPCTTSATSGTDGTCSACASCGEASTSTLPTRKRPSNSSASTSRSAAIWALAGACDGE